MGNDRVFDLDSFWISLNTLEKYINKYVLVKNIPFVGKMVKMEIMRSQKEIYFQNCPHQTVTIPFSSSAG